MQYFYATYLTRDGEHEYREGGVLSAATEKQAERKAKKGKVIFDRPCWERYCAHDSLREVSVVDYLVLKKYICNIDRYFDEDGELRE